VSDADDFRDDVVFDSAMLLGVWANGTRVVRRSDEFTIDFLRDVAELPRPVLVARALVPPAAAFDLRDQLDDALRSYTEFSMPVEPPDVG
jgi:hypothetical protein